MTGGQAARMAKSKPASAEPREMLATPARVESAASAAEPSPRHRAFLVVWYSLNFVLICSFLAAAYCVGWEYSTRRYLKGFSDAIIPLAASPEEKIASILNWMAHGPGRQVSAANVPLTDRDPTDTLNYASLLQVCGTATNAFINLADSSGLATRRLLLLDSNRATVHVVAEVLIGGRWIIVDPAYRTMPRSADGGLLTAQDLANSQVFAAATGNIPGYDSSYAYTLTTHVRVSRIAYMGRPLRAALDRLLPGWEDSTTASLLLERKSMAYMTIALAILFLLLLVRTAVRWYGERHMGLRAMRIRSQMKRAVVAFLDTAS